MFVADAESHPHMIPLDICENPNWRGEALAEYISSMCLRTSHTLFQLLPVASPPLKCIGDGLSVKPIVAPGSPNPCGLFTDNDIPEGCAICAYGGSVRLAPTDVAAADVICLPGDWQIDDEHGMYRSTAQLALCHDNMRKLLCSYAHLRQSTPACLAIDDAADANDLNAYFCLHSCVLEDDTADRFLAPQYVVPILVASRQIQAGTRVLARAIDEQSVAAFDPKLEESAGMIRARWNKENVGQLVYSRDHTLYAVQSLRVHESWHPDQRPGARLCRRLWERLLQTVQTQTDNENTTADVHVTIGVEESQSYSIDARAFHDMMATSARARQRATLEWTADAVSWRGHVVMAPPKK